MSAEITPIFNQIYKSKLNEPLSHELLEELIRFLTHVYSQQETVSFNVLASVFEAELFEEIDRIKLYLACEYLCQCKHFDAEFWRALFKDCI